MLRYLRLQDFVLVEETRLELTAGLTVVTGETGAGKSLLLDALRLLRGDRANASDVRQGARRAVVEALVGLGGNPALGGWLEENGFGRPDELVVRREVFASGGSRAWLNGSLATAGQLREAAALFMQVHGQHDQTGLVEPARQRDCLDLFCGAERERESTAAAFRAWRCARARADAMARSESDAESRLDFLRFQLAELEDLGLGDFDHGALLEERGRLASVDRLREGAACAGALLSGGEDSPDVVGAVGEAAALVAELAAVDPAFQQAADGLAEAATLADDALRGIERAATNLEADPERLGAIEERLHAVERVARKHRCRPDELASLVARLAAEASELEDRDASRERAEREAEEALAAWRAEAACLSNLRAKGARKLGDAVQRLLRPLAMAAARFRVDVQTRPADAPPSGYGVDDIQFQFRPNPGEPEAPLRAIASGGECSRVMLALLDALAEKERTPFLVFDEVDAGLSGAAAAAVGERLVALSRGRQVFCITHQASIASRADAHLLAVKKTARGRTTSRIEVLSVDARKLEIARLLDGGASAKSFELAGEMLLDAG